MGFDLLFVCYTLPSCSLFLALVEVQRDGKKVDATGDWVRVTTQLRKYVLTTGVLDVLLVDHLCAIYLKFTSPDQGALFDLVEFIIIPNDQDVTSTDGLG